jgi:hypothetical protein
VEQLSWHNVGSDSEQKIFFFFPENPGQPQGPPMGDRGKAAGV